MKNPPFPHQIIASFSFRSVRNKVLEEFDLLAVFQGIEQALGHERFVAELTCGDLGFGDFLFGSGSADGEGVTGR